MRTMFRVALCCILAASLSVPALAADVRKKKHFFMKHDYTAAYTLQRVSVRATCFPERLKAILAHIAKETGKKPIVTSGHRPRAGKSQHTNCLAADIRVPGVSEKKIVAIAARAPGIGGIGRYCNGIVHVDIGPQRRWNYC